MRTFTVFAVVIQMMIPLFVHSQETTSDFVTLKEQMTEKSLPLVNLTADLNSVNKTSYVPATIEIADFQKRTNGEAEVMFACKIKYRGGSSLSYDKKSFAVKLLDDEGESLDASILDIRKDDAWILDAMAIDRIRMRNRVNFDIWNEMSRTPYETKYDNRNGTEGYYVELFINGDYHGLYCMSDKINRKLLGLDKAKEIDDETVTINGVLYKCNQWCSAAYLAGYDEEEMTGEEWNCWELQYPDDYPCEQAYTPLRDFIDFCSNSSIVQFIEEFDDRCYRDNFIDYHVFVLSQGLVDNIMKNTFLSMVNINNVGDDRVMITPWDLDSSLGGAWNGSYSTSPFDNTLVLITVPYKRLWNYDADYATAVADRWRSLRLSTLSNHAVRARLDNYAQQFIESGAWAREYAKWNGNPVELKEDINEELNYVKEWYEMNATAIDTNIFNGVGGIDAIVSDDELLPADGCAYNVLGQRVSDGYKGFVIKNRRKYISM
ncbi:MAG: CotH kinase family protein [Muribaculaceae bacterium]